MIYHFEVKSGSTVAPPKPTGSAFSISPQKDYPNSAKDSARVNN